MQDLTPITRKDRLKGPVHARQHVYSHSLARETGRVKTVIPSRPSIKL